MAFQIVKPAEASEGFDYILYGEPKTGKTSTLDDPKYKVLHLDLEGGSAVLNEAENVERIVIPDYKTLIEVYTAIEKKELGGYDLYCIDSLTRFESLVKEYIFKKYTNRRRPETSGGFGGQQDWGDLRTLITRTVEWIHGLTKRGEDSIHNMYIAHVADKKEPIPGTDQERIVSKKVALQGGNTAEIVMSIVDGVFYMYNKHVVVDKDKGTTKLERGILTKDMGLFVANARQSKKRDPLPANIPNPVWSEILPQLGYTKNQKPLVSAKK